MFLGFPAVRNMKNDIILKILTQDFYPLNFLITKNREKIANVS